MFVKIKDESVFVAKNYFEYLLGAYRVYSGGFYDEYIKFGTIRGRKIK